LSVSAKVIKRTEGPRGPSKAGGGKWRPTRVISFRALDNYGGNIGTAATKIRSPRGAIANRAGAFYTLDTLALRGGLF
jgi:hypothetical protein